MSQLQKGSYVTQFTLLAKTAQTFKGMRVIPVESDEWREERYVIGLMSLFLSDRGGFDRNEVVDDLSKKIALYKGDLVEPGYAPPEVFEAVARARLMIRRLEKMSILEARQRVEKALLV